MDLITGLPPFVVIIILALAFTLPLACPSFELDVYSRYIGTAPGKFQQFFCLPNNSQNEWRQGIVQGTITVLGILVSSCCVQIGVDAFHKLSTTHGGVTISYAEALLKLPSPATGRNLFTRLRAAMEHEPRTHTKVKLLLLAGILLTPLFASTAAPMASIVYTSKSMRLDQFAVNVSAIPNWISTPNLEKYGWMDVIIKEANSYFQLLPGFYSFTNQVVYNDIYWSANGATNSSRTPGGYEGDSLWQFMSGDGIILPGKGSGLQTAHIAVPPDASPATRGVVPLENVLLTPGPFNYTKQGAVVPMSSQDFTIEQSMLVVDPVCSAFMNDYFDRQRMSAILNNTFWDHELLLNVSSPEYPVFSRDVDVDMFASAINGTRWRVWRMELNDWGRFTYNRAGNHSWSQSAQEQLPEESYKRTYIDTDELPLYYTYKWNKSDDGAEALVIYTASPKPWFSNVSYPNVTGLLCKTAVFPIKYNTTIPPGFSSTRTIPSTYQRTAFTAASRQLVEQALNFTVKAVDMMTRNESFLPATKDRAPFPLMSDAVQLCSAPYAAPNMISGPRSDDDYYRKYPFYNVSGDSCVGSEFERLFRAALLFFSFIPSDAPPKQWYWGPAELRYVPNKRYCGVMLALLLALAVALAVLIRKAWVPPESYGSIDITAPWASKLAELSASEADMQAACIVKHDPAMGVVDVVPPPPGSFKRSKSAGQEVVVRSV